MDDREYFIRTSFAYQLKAAKRELAEFRSGAAYEKLRSEYEGIIREQAQTIKRLQRERDEFSFSRKEITRNWMEVLEDMQKEHEKEVKEQNRRIETLLDMIASLVKRNSELEKKWKKALADYYEKASELEDANGKISKLTAQVNRDYENSSLPSSKCLNRKKITNNRDRTGRKPGAQPGHKHHPRRKLTPTHTVEIEPDQKYLDTTRYIPTGKEITKQVVGIAVRAVVTQYHTKEFYDKKTGHKVHSPFPDGVTDDVNYDASLKAFAFLLNNRCNVSLEKTAEFISGLTAGELRPSVGMMNGLCREFSSKSTPEQDQLFRTLLDAPVMHTDGTNARVNGKNCHVVVCCNEDATMYFARESKKDEELKETPVETYGGILIHDHEKRYYNYGSDHQECMVHILRYLKSSMENEPGRTWNVQMRDLVREMIHAVNQSETGVLEEEARKRYSERYDAIVRKAEEEYTDEPPNEYYKEGYNLYLRMAEYKHNHLLFLENPYVAADNNLSERHARVLKGKMNQAVSLRSFEHLSDYCDCLGVIESLSKKKDRQLYDEVKDIFRRARSLLNPETVPGTLQTT